MNFPITASKQLSKLTRELEIHNWGNLVNYVQKLPYGRNENRTDLSLVLKEKKGSCSSKHAFLREVAIENSQTNIQLVLAIYKMNAKNTNIGDVLEGSGLEYIPEAHCYLKINGERIDVTSNNASFKKIEKEIISEIIISPDQVADFKVKYHQDFIKTWILEKKIQKTFDEIWETREGCIQYLSEN